METRFSVAPEHAEAAVAWMAERGFAPCRIEPGDGEAVLVFAPCSDARLHALVMALPAHLSRKIGIIVGDRPPFSPRS